MSNSGPDGCDNLQEMRPTSWPRSPAQSKRFAKDGKDVSRGVDANTVETEHWIVMWLGIEKRGMARDDGSCDRLRVRVFGWDRAGGPIAGS